MVARQSAESTIDPQTRETELFEAAVSRAAELPGKVVLELAESLRADGDHERCETLLALLDKRDGTSAGLLEARARLAYSAGRLDEALESLEARVALKPSATASIAVARFHLETGDIEEARRIGETLMASHPDLLTVHGLAGSVARAAGNRKAARSYFLTMAELKLEHPGALLTLAELCLEDADMSAAREFFKRAVASMKTLDYQSVPLLEDAVKIALALGQDALADDLASQRDAAALARREAKSQARIASLEAALSGTAAPKRARPEPLPGSRSPRSAPPPVSLLETFAAPSVESTSDDPRVLETLRSLFGHDALRPGQADVINQVMAGQDTLAVMPTGAGKSLTFQLPAMLRDGATIVISPLIALMKDQVDGLPPAVRAKTALINSTLSADEMRARLAELRRGELKLVYVAPERLRQHGFLKTLRETKIATVVIDEAHCISMWGHDFRPDYLFIPRALKEIGDPPVLAITATATQQTALHIAEGLDRSPALIRTSVFRPNLFYSVVHCANRDEKIGAMVEFCVKTHGSGIVYVSSRKDAEGLAGVLRSRRVSAGHYHAGMNPTERSQAQEDFMSGQTRVIVATVAFGMGIDKADVRFIVRFSPPASLEAYAQESGRAGRDGKPAKCLLLIANSDESTLKRFIRRDQISIAELRSVYQGIRRQAAGNWAILDISSLATPGDDDDGPDARIALGLLDQARLIHRHPDAPFTMTLRFNPGSLDSVRLDPEHEAAWLRLRDWLGPEALDSGAINLHTAAACDAADLAPAELDRLLSELPNLVVREGQRGICLELMQAGPDSASTMQRLLEKARDDAETRIDRVISFASAGQCRHQALAAHLGERLDPCKTACDVCTGAVKAQKAEAPRKTRLAAPGDRLILLKALHSAPFSLGAPSLVRLVMGSAESKIQRDRSPQFGALDDLKKSAIERLIDELIDEDLIERYERDGYRLLAVTQAGAETIGARYISPESAPRW